MGCRISLLSLCARLVCLGFCFGKSCLLGTEFGEPRIPLVEFCVKYPYSAKVQALKRCQFRPQAGHQKLLIRKLRFKPRQFFSFG